MDTGGKNIQKRVLDALKDELQPLSDDGNTLLTGGFASGGQDPIAEFDPSTNINCGGGGGNACCVGKPTNSVAGCAPNDSLQ
jgi:hypothetical protein